MIRVFRFVYRQKHSGVLYFRWSVPLRYRHILGRSVIKRSLSTTDKQVAIIRGMELLVSIHKQIQHAERVRAPRKKKDRNGLSMKRWKSWSPAKRAPSALFGFLSPCAMERPNASRLTTETPTRSVNQCSR